MATEAPVKQYFTGIIKQVSEFFLTNQNFSLKFFEQIANYFACFNFHERLAFQRFCGIQDRNIKVVCFTEPVLTFVFNFWLQCCNTFLSFCKNLMIPLCHIFPKIDFTQNQEYFHFFRLWMEVQ